MFNDLWWDGTGPNTRTGTIHYNTERCPHLVTWEICRVTTHCFISVMLQFLVSCMFTMLRIWHGTSQLSVIIVILLLLYWLHPLPCCKDTVMHACIICSYIFDCWDIFIWMIWAAMRWNWAWLLFCQMFAEDFKILHFDVYRLFHCFVSSTPDIHCNFTIGKIIRDLGL